MRLILASESPYRKELLERLNLNFECSPANIDEESIWNKNLSPLQVSTKLAEMKAQKVLDENPNAIVIGSDQVIAINNKILGKPKTEQKALEQLSELQNGPHLLITAVCILSRDKKVSFENETTLQIRSDLTQQELQNYIKYDLPLNCAGSYKIEGMGIALFEKIETSDFTSIIGLPLMQTAKNLKEFGIEVFR